jgi:hypothetical protein
MIFDSSGEKASEIPWMSKDVLGSVEPFRVKPHVDTFLFGLLGEPILLGTGFYLENSIQNLLHKVTLRHFMDESF